MGVSWHSHAEVISLEPEKIKQLIEEIDNDDNYDTSFIRDLRIEDNSVFFNSGGYGCYGYGEGYKDLLFKILLEKYEGAIGCFEYVQPCQSQNFYFAITYFKSETKQSTYRYAFIMEESESSYNVIKTSKNHWDYVELTDSSLNKFDQEEAYIWSIPNHWLTREPEDFVSLNSIYNKCGINGLKITHSLIDSLWNRDLISDEEYYSAMGKSEPYYGENNELKIDHSLIDSWRNSDLISDEEYYSAMEESKSYCCGNNELKITHSLINTWWNSGVISDNEYYSAMEELKSRCVEQLQYQWLELFFQFKSSLPSNFPRFKIRTKYSPIDIKTMTEQINSITNLTDTDKTIDELLSEGYQGVNYELIDNEGFVATANHFTDKIQWLKTFPDADGDIGLMTLDVQAFDELLDFMLDKFGWCPKVYSNKSAPEILMFTPENELEEIAIELTTEGEYGWKGSLYRLAYVEKYQDKIGLIFATKPEDSEQQDWLLVQIDQKNKERGWSVHDGTLEQVYYIMAEEIEIPEPNYNPTPEQITKAIKGLSAKEDDLIEFETTGMITAEKAIELSKAYIQAQEDGDEEKCIGYCQQLNAQKKANNLEYNPEIEDELIEFPDYLDELIDLLDDEEAIKFHEQIAYDLVEGDYTNLYDYDLDQISACSPSYTLKGLLKLWKRTYNAPKLNESCNEAEYLIVDVIPKTYVIIGDAFYFHEVFYGIDDDKTINKDFAIAVLLQYTYDNVNERVNAYENAYQDFEYILPQLVDPEVLDAMILEGFSEVTYSKFNLQKALENPNLSEESLSFILDFCCGNDLSDYDCYERYEETIDEEIESLDDDARISLLKRMIKHPNVTQEILEQLINSEYEQVAEFAKEKLQEFK